MGSYYTETSYMKLTGLVGFFWVEVVRKKIFKVFIIFKCFTALAPQLQSSTFSVEH